MVVSNLHHQSTPTPLRNLIRRSSSRVANWANRQPFIWEGVYRHYRDVPSEGEGFNSEAWLSDMEHYTERAISALKEHNNGIPHDVPQYHSLFAMSVSMLRVRQQSLRVLDLGGGMGIGCANLLRSLIDQSGIEYWIIENEKSCERGARLFSEVPFVRFSSTLPENIGGVDLIVLSSVLQFIEDYHGLLTRLSRYRPTFWLFTFLPAGKIPTFASSQKNVPGSTIPVWFFNLEELLEKMKALGYDLVFKSALDRVFDMRNFPVTHQLSRQCSLLFTRH